MSVEAGEVQSKNDHRARWVVGVLLVGAALIVGGLAALAWVSSGLGAVMLTLGALVVLAVPFAVAAYSSRWAYRQRPHRDRIPFGGTTGEETWFRWLTRERGPSDTPNKRDGGQ